MNRHWELPGDMQSLDVQTSEHKYSTVPVTPNVFKICTLQLWMFAIRHFTYRQPRSHSSQRGSSEALSLGNLALLARRLGFKSEQIAHIQSSNMRRNVAKDFLQALCQQELCKVEDSRLHQASRQLHSFLRNLEKLGIPEDVNNTVVYTTDDQYYLAKHRFNKPTRDQFVQQREFLFVHYISSSDQAISQYPTPIGVTRDILCSFFGYDIRNMLSNYGNSPSVGHSSPGIDETMHDIPLSHDGDAMADSPSEYSEHLDTAPALSSQNILEPYQTDTTHAMTDPPPIEYSEDQNIAPDVPLSPVLEPHQTEIHQDREQATPDSPLSHMPVVSEPIPLYPHPSGTPEPSLPLACGFEDLSCIAPMECEAFISSRKTTAEILSDWSQSRKEVIVIWMFELRAYYKFKLGDSLALRSLIKNLSRNHIFMIIKEDFDGMGVPEIENTLKEAIEQRLLVGAKQDNPSGTRTETTIDYLKQYVKEYDIHTGKRKIDAIGESRDSIRRAKRSAH
ncbi:hypothetical protein N7454_003228 [Penicillium verhagenii]|nr:hypothetical protein N7454_003228 [Penicillium verhagenii]